MNYGVNTFRVRMQPHNCFWLREGGVAQRSCDVCASEQNPPPSRGINFFIPSSITYKVFLELFTFWLQILRIWGGGTDNPHMGQTSLLYAV
jgi:hypothetical protein